MAKDFKVEEIMRFSVRIVKVFMNALEKFGGPYLFGREELVYMHDEFAVWLKENEECIVRLNELLDLEGHVPNGQEQLLSDLYEKMKYTCGQAESFERAFAQLCHKREIKGIAEVMVLFEASQN